MEEQIPKQSDEQDLQTVQKIPKKSLFTNKFFILSLFLSVITIATAGAIVLSQQQTKLTSNAATTAVTIPVLADATVRGGKPNKNFGSEKELQVDSDKIAYLKFDLTSLAGQPITKATLRLYITNNSNSVQMIKDAPTNWNENTITFVNKPTPGAVIAQIANTQQPVWKELDITSYINANTGKIISLAIDASPSNTNNLYFMAKGNTNPPVIVVEKTTNGSTPTPTIAPTITTIPLSPNPSVITTPTTTTQPPVGMRPLPDPWYGVTVDDVSNTTNIVNSSKALSRKPITRIVFDEGVAASYYVPAVNKIQPDSYIMGELLDSEGLKNSTLQQYHDRMASYLAALGDKVDVWEIGNEVNGNWTGPYAQVSAKLYDAYQQVEAAGKRSELTLWYNDGCGNGPSELDPIAFSQQYIPADMRNGLDYVLVSYYETQCNNIRPTEAKLTTFFNQLHAVYPNAKIGFGEIGFPTKVGSNIAPATSMINYYYGLKITTPGYIGGYFWWYYYQDMLPHTSKPLWTVLNSAFQLY